MDDVYKLRLLFICQNWLARLVVLETKRTNSKIGYMLVLRVPSNLTYTIFRMVQFEAILGDPVSRVAGIFVGESLL